MSITNGEEELTRPARLSDHLVLGSKFASVAAGDLYSATRKIDGQEAWVWRLRFPVSPEAAAVFRKRQSLIALYAPVLSYGIDLEGIPFVISTPPAQGLLRPQEIPMERAEDIFIRCIELVCALEERGLVCGSLSCHSFGLDAEGKVVLLEALGVPQLWGLPFDEGSVPEEVSVYLAPEVRRGEAPTRRSDLYSLAVLGSRLLNRSLSESQTTAPLFGDPLIWSQQVFDRCLDPDPANRLKNVNALLEVAILAKEEAWRKAREAHSDGAIPLLKDAAERANERQDALDGAAKKSGFGDISDVPRSHRVRRLRGRLLLIGVLLGVAAPFVFLYSLNSRSKVQTAVAPPPPVATAAPTATPSFDNLSDEELLSRLNKQAETSPFGLTAAMTAAHTRGLVSDTTFQLFEEMKEESSATPVPRAAFKLLLGPPTGHTLDDLASWTHPLKHRLLLLHLRDTADAEVQGRMLWQLSRLSAFAEPVREAIQALSQQDSDAEACRRILVLALTFSTVTPAEKEEFIRLIAALPKPNKATDELVKLGDPVMTATIIDAVGNELSFATLLKYLRGADYELKVSLIKRLSTRQQYPELGMIREQYFSEIDPKVKELYEQTFPAFTNKSG